MVEFVVAERLRSGRGATVMAVVPCSFVRSFEDHLASVTVTLVAGIASIGLFSTKRSMACSSVHGGLSAFRGAVCDLRAGVEARPMLGGGGTRGSLERDVCMSVPVG